MDVLLSVILGLIVVFVTLKKEAFTVPAAISAFIILVIAGFCGSYACIAIVLISYFIVFAVDIIFGKKTEKIVCNINQKHGKRDIVQVLSNGFAASVAVILAKVLSEPLFLLVYASALTECLADSLASDIGVLSKKNPVDICKMKRIEKGLSGGVSLLGTSGAFLGCLVMWCVSMLFFGANVKVFVSILIIPMAGILIDSILGSLIQAKYTCTICKKKTEKTVHCGEKTHFYKGIRFINNDAVNMISNILTATIAAIYVLLA